MRVSLKNDHYGRTIESAISTFRGRKFWPIDPRPEEVYIEDIAHALSNQCRYNGHCRWFYSVAQHSVLMSDALRNPKVPRFDLAAQWALLHDAAEAYLSDICTPVKRQIPGWAVIEDNLLKTIGMAFQLPWPPPQVVRDADLRMLATEKRDLVTTKEEWECLKGVKPYDFPIIYQQPEYAERVFLRRAKELFKGVL